MRIRTQRVPAGYRELEYIESTGTQYIDSGVNLSSNNFKVECDFINTVNDYSREQAIFSIWTSTYNYWNVFIDYSKKIDLYTAGHTYGDIVALKTKYNLSLTRNSTTWTLKLGDSTVTKTYSPSSTNTTTLKIFTRGDVPSTSYSNTYIQMFYLKVTVGGTLVRNLVPCERLSDNKPGMYDTVNNVFYTNSGTGEFIKGPYKDSYKLSLLRLPTTYQEVEYIQSSGTQYIDTGVNTDSNLGIDCHIDSTDNYFGAIKEQVGSNYIRHHGYNFYYAFSTYEYPQLSITGDSKLIVDTVNKKITVDGTSSTLPNVTFDIGVNYWLFRRNSNNSSLRYYANMKVYYFKIYKSGELVRNFIPCYRKSDNVIGLYDIIEGKFYTNQGSGTFTKGNDVKNLGMFTPKMLMYNYNQLFYPFTSDNWISNDSSIVYNSDGSMIVTRTGNANYSGTQMSSSKASPFYASHKYFYSCKYYADTVAGKGASVGLNLYSTGSGYVITEAQDISEKTWYTDEKIFQPTRDSSGTIYPWIFVNQRSDRTVGDKITLKEIVFIDLTDWYGIGKEPTTVSEFKTRFYRDYYGSCSKSIRLTENMINAEPTYGYNQLVQNGNFETSSLSGFYFGWNVKSYRLEDKILKFEQQSQYTLSGVGVNAQPVIGHKYFIGCDVISYNSNAVTFVTGFGYQYASGITVPAGQSTRYEVLLTKGSDTGTQYNYVTWGNNAASSTLYSWGIRNVMIIDLTDWYGAGSEPATVAEFKNSFPYKYYQYMKKTLLNKYMINELGTN